MSHMTLLTGSERLQRWSDDARERILEAAFRRVPLVADVARGSRYRRARSTSGGRNPARALPDERVVQPVPKLGAWVERLTEILEKESKLPRRERRSTQRLFEELRGHGYDGAHDSVHRFTKAWRDERTRTPSHAFSQVSSPAEKRDYIRSHRPADISAAQGCRLMGLARSTSTTPSRAAARRP